MADLPSDLQVFSFRLALLLILSVLMPPILKTYIYCFQRPVFTSETMTFALCVLFANIGERVLGSE